jgi:TRAP-type mannitol/chloroaromatic compound transport system permease large subunit
LDNDKRHDAFVNVGGLDGLRGNAFKVEQTKTKRRLGFFIDFVEISLIIVPIFYPIALSLGIDMQWFAILIAMNLQTSFLTPPFGNPLSNPPAPVNKDTIFIGVKTAYW